jgi:hypothetical protein
MPPGRKEAYESPLPGGCLSYLLKRTTVALPPWGQRPRPA